MPGHHVGGERQKLGGFVEALAARDGADTIGAMHELRSRFRKKLDETYGFHCEQNSLGIVCVARTQRAVHEIEVIGVPGMSTTRIMGGPG